MSIEARINAASAAMSAFVGLVVSEGMLGEMERAMEMACNAPVVCKRGDQAHELLALVTLDGEDFSITLGSGQPAGGQA